ncbi:ABC transporter substrate-binding protein [Allobranchiibius sp. CTAmp26]|uniref:ABC transporter substrate-binding protein n=1 Tax=Allobranchiibius sp. CTAmp26 TaxID=2815214 RepID=UPI001FB64B27|nr:ABC transporter substrate-binding protein [Allobranchiibius sp. CTAmp26]
MTFALSSDLDMLDPTLSRSLYSRYVFDSMCQKLYDVNAKTNVVPQLATAMPKISDGGKTVTITIRSGVKFSDGTAFNASAVKATIERNLNLVGTARKTELGPISSVDAPNATTVVVHLKQPFAPLTAALADRAGMIMSPAAIQKYGKNFAQHPSCVGPFKLQQRVPGSSITLVRDPNFYDSSKVHFDKIVYRIITDPNVRSANLLSGDAEVADTLSTDSVVSLQSNPKITVLRSQSLGYQGVTFNIGNANGVGNPPKALTTPAASKAAVREALEYSINRPLLIKSVFNNLYSPACSPIPTKSPFSQPVDQQCAPYDPAKSKKLLAQAGVKTPFRLDMLVSNTPDTLRMVQALQSMVKAGGFDLNIQPVEYTTLLNLEDQGKFTALQLGWSGRVDPDANLTNFVGTQGSQNVSGYSNPKVDTLLNRAQTTNDLSTRKSLYGQVVQITRSDAPIVYLYRQSNLTGIASTIKGVQTFPDGVVRVAFAGFSK